MLSDWLKQTPPGSAAVFVFAHPDDEFFCLPLISAERAGGRAVHVVYLTDGGHLAGTRERESLAVLTAHGVSPEHVRFAGREHGWRDGALFRCLAAAKAWLGEHLASLAPIARIYVTAYEGGHHDHDCCFGLVATLSASVGAIALQFPLYTGSGLKGPFFRTMAPLAENGEHLDFPLTAHEGLRCWKTSTAYPSQWKTWIALGPTAAWPYLVRRSIVLQRVDAARLGRPPHAGVPYYQRRFKVAQHEVLQALASISA